MFSLKIEIQSKNIQEFVDVDNAKEILAEKEALIDRYVFTAGKCSRYNQ